MTPPRIRTPEDLEAALGAAWFLLFKHSPRCSISTRAYAVYRDWVDAHPETTTGWIDVVEDRPLSLEAARQTGVTHASPQVLLLQAGRARWSASHFTITTQALEEAIVDPS